MPAEQEMCLCRALTGKLMMDCSVYQVAPINEHPVNPVTIPHLFSFFSSAPAKSYFNVDCICTHVFMWWLQTQASLVMLKVCC